MMRGKPPLLVIAGPTASGKTAAALARARAEPATIINADASQLYRDIPILSAQPSEAEQAQVPHRLFGIRDGALPCSAAEWAGLARAEIAAAHASGRLPILVGGTGLYLRTLIAGISDVPAIPDSVRTPVRRLDVAELRHALEAEDPAMAARLHPNDRQRQARALEVMRATGRSLGAWQAETRGGIGTAVMFDVGLILPPRAVLAQAIDDRFDRMMAAGALDEVRRLAARGLNPMLPVMKALGIPPLLAHLEGALPLADAVARAKHETRRFAKRQLTWFATGGQSALLGGTRLPLS